MIPQNDTDSTELAQLFFSCVAGLMANQLRSMVIDSLADFLDFFKVHEVLKFSFPEFGCTVTR